MSNQDNINQASLDGAANLISPVQKNSELFYNEYQQRCGHALAAALEQYRYVYAIRCIFYFPKRQRKGQIISDDDIITNFVESFNAQHIWDLPQPMRMNLHRQDYCVRFACAIEDQIEQSEFDVTILLNHDAVFGFGDDMTNRDNMFRRLMRVWANAVGLPVTRVNELIRVPKNPDHYLSRDNQDSIADFIKSISPAECSSTVSHSFSTIRY